LSSFNLNNKSSGIEGTQSTSAEAKFLFGKDSPIRSAHYYRAYIILLYVAHEGNEK